MEAYVAPPKPHKYPGSCRPALASHGYGKDLLRRRPNCRRSRPSRSPQMSAAHGPETTKREVLASPKVTPISEVQKDDIAS